MDLSARVVAEQLAKKWGQGVVVENRQGADAIPAVTAFLSARDNHTFLFSFGQPVTFNHLLHPKLPYDINEVVPLVPVIENFMGMRSAKERIRACQVRNKALAAALDQAAAVAS